MLRIVSVAIVVVLGLLHRAQAAASTVGKLILFSEVDSGADPRFLEGGFKYTKGVRFVGFTQLFK